MVGGFLAALGRDDVCARRVSLFQDQIQDIGRIDPVTEEYRF